MEVRRVDIGVGLHGDHIGGERHAARALFAADPAGQVDAACMIDSNLLLFGREGGDAGRRGARARADPLYDHCTMTAGPSADAAAVARFGEVLLGMDYADASLRPLLDLEGLKEWRPPRLSGYDSWNGPSTRRGSTTAMARSPPMTTGRKGRAGANRHASTTPPPCGPR